MLLPITGCYRLREFYNKIDSKYYTLSTAVEAQEQLTSNDQVSLNLYIHRFPAVVELMACRCGQGNKYSVAR